MAEKHPELLPGGQVQQAPPLDAEAPAGLAQQPEHRGSSAGGATLPPAGGTAHHTGARPKVRFSNPVEPQEPPGPLAEGDDDIHTGSESCGSGLSPVGRLEPGGALAEEEDDSNAGSEPSGSCLSPDAGQQPGVPPSELRDPGVPDWVPAFAELLGGVPGLLELGCFEHGQHYPDLDAREPAGFVLLPEHREVFPWGAWWLHPADGAAHHTDGRFFDMVSLPGGVKGADTLVRALVTRRRYDQIVTICGRDSLAQRRESAHPDYAWKTIIKIPEANFDEVLGLDTYCRGKITLEVAPNPGSTGWDHANETELIFLVQAEQAFLFYGKKDVLAKLNVWKRRCEEISRRIQNEKTGTGRRLAEAAAWRDKYQIGVSSGKRLTLSPHLDCGGFEPRVTWANSFPWWQRRNEQRIQDIRVKEHETSVENTEETSSGSGASMEASQESSVENTEETSSGASASKEARQESSVENTEETSSGASDSKEAREESSVENTEETSSGASASKEASEESSVENTEETSSGASDSKEARGESSVENTEETSSAASASKEARQEVTEDDNTTDHTDPGPDGSGKVEYHNGRYGGDFIEEGIIGKGGFGVVVKARNKMDKYVYAVKEVFKKARDDLSMKQVLREVKFLARLSHPNIIVYKQAWVEETTASFSSHRSSSNNATMGRDGSASDGADHSTPGESSEENVSESKDIHCLLYIQMELCGKSLDDTLQSWIEQSAYLYLSDTLKNAVLIIFKQLLEALHYIHSKGIIHRDVKPANIFFVRSERLEPKDILQAQDEVLVKLGDFGLATQSTQHECSLGLLPRQPGSGLTKGVGTAIYAAPEQMTMTSYSNKVDIYSLGVVLAELLCLFPTTHERCQLERLRSGAAPDRLLELSETERYLAHTIQWMCRNYDAHRPSAKSLLESGLVVTKDTIVTESEERGEMLSLLIRYTYLRLEEA